MNKFSIVAAIVLGVPSVVTGSIVVSYDAPNSQTTTVAGALQYTFNSNPLGISNNVQWKNGNTTVGTFDKLFVQASNGYGGSNNTPYATVGAPSSLLSTTLTFAAPERYFGFEWLAVDAENSLNMTFYDRGNVVATFNSSTLLAALGTCPDSNNPYCGNPNARGVDNAEKFVYVNFTGTADTVITSVTFSNMDANTGFEYDSLAVSSSAVTPPGTLLTSVSAPEPVSLALTFGGLTLAGLFGRKRLRKQK